MTLASENRVLLTDALRPPAGYRVEIAVGTTYSMNLTALLLAPLSFAVFENVEAGNLDAMDPIRLLEAVRRHAEHTTVFCQAGGIHVPSNYRSILTFVEDSVHEVVAPGDGAIFHPKIWALRFCDQEGRRSHRLLCLSRNMTLDRSWDTALVLDQAEDGVIDAGPAADFVRRLPDLVIRPLGQARIDEIADLSASLSRVRLAAPSPFTDGELLPLGLDGKTHWPFPDRARRLLAISPFLTKPAVRSLAHIASERTMVSRAESLEQIGSTILRGWSVKVMQRLAEVDPGEDVSEASVAVDEFQWPNEGLHAKTFVLDLPGSLSRVITGSANLTSAGWGSSVEFEAVLTGPTGSCGVAAVLDGSAEVPGLSRLLEDYAVTSEPGATDEAIKTSYTLDRFHAALALSGPTLLVIRSDAERVQATLALAIPDDPPGTTRIWLTSLPSGAHVRNLDEPLSWTIARINVTPFVAIETTAGHGDARVTRRCVIKATLTGDIDDRRQDAVFSILHTKRDVLRYLIFLLGDPAYDALFAELAGVDGDGFAPDSSRAGVGDVALLEPLVRAIGRDEDSLARVASVINELQDTQRGADLVPDGVNELWKVVWQVHSERTT